MAINERLESLRSSLEPRLDELYNKMQAFPLTEKRGYENTLAFVKGLGFKVLRNSQGKHKLIQ